MKMIDVGEKERTSRVAIARAELKCSRGALKLLNEGRLEKGDALAAARLAGIMAAKHTPQLLPLCHTISIAGAEVEAMTAACAAALTVYDMMKRYDRGMELVSLRLVKKSGGRSGEWVRQGEEVRDADPAPAPRPGKKASKG